MHPFLLRLVIEARGFGDIIKVAPITCWDMLEKKTDLFEFNHIEDGHSEEWKPVAQSEVQRKAWHNQAWRREHAYLVNGEVMSRPP